MLSSTDLAFYLQLYNFSPRANRSMLSIRELLPDAPLYLLSDGGVSMDEEAKAFNAGSFQSEAWHGGESVWGLQRQEQDEEEQEGQEKHQNMRKI